MVARRAVDDLGTVYEVEDAAVTRAGAMVVVATVEAAMVAVGLAVDLEAE